MAFLAKSHDVKNLKLTSYKSGVVQAQFVLNKRKILIGSAPSCDIIIDDGSVSHYHAMIFMDENGGRIIDLESKNGVYLNQASVKDSFFLIGDHLEFGASEFYVEETLVDQSTKAPSLVNQDEGKVNKIVETNRDDFLPELPPLPGLVLIDGEYCDILFQDEEFTAVSSPYIDSIHFSRENYIDVDAPADFIPIIKNKKGHSIEVTIVCSGNVLSVDYLPVKNNIYKIAAGHHGPHTICLPNLDSSERHPFVQIKNDTINVFPIKGHTLVGEDELDNEGKYLLSTDKTLNFVNGTTQVFIRKVKSPPGLSFAPFFGRDREVKKQTAGVFSTIMSIMLLLLFIDVNPDPPDEKKIAVIYRKAIKAQKIEEKASSEPVKENVDVGVKKNETPQKETKMAQEKQKKVETKTASAPPKAAEKTPSPPVPAPTTPKVAEVKTYTFKMKNSLTAFLGTKAPTTMAKFDQPSAPTSSFNGIQVNQASDTLLKSATQQNVGTLGKDFKGELDTSTGTAGLASKSGIDTAYVDPKTVVLGSMDPELLRKILREYLPQFRHCYQNEIDRHSKLLKGVVDLKFRINGKGRVDDVQVLSRGAKFSSGGVDCMSQVLRKIDFPVPKGGGVVDVKQPLNFRSERSNI